MIARWKPVHLGHAAVLEALADRADRLVIGVGSANRYDVANPFTFGETAAMIRAVLGDRDDVAIVGVPDLWNGPMWRAMVVAIFGPLDLFATANPYVYGLLAPDYAVVHPGRLVARDRHVALDGTMVRSAMARGDDWRSLVPDPVASLLESRGLVERFRREFGTATLALERHDP